MTDFPRKRPNDSAAYEYTPMKEVAKAKWAVWLVDGDDDFDRRSDSDSRPTASLIKFFFINLRKIKEGIIHLN